RAIGLRCAIASTTYWRDAKSYWDDFDQLGMTPYIDTLVTSVDAGHLKLHPAVFELSVRAAGVPAEQCVVIGNKESNDIEPGLAMGMRAILVHHADPPPSRRPWRSPRSRAWRAGRSCTRCSRLSRSWAPRSAATARRGSCWRPARCWTRTPSRRATRSARRWRATSAGARAT